MMMPHILLFLAFLSWSSSSFLGHSNGEVSEEGCTFLQADVTQQQPEVTTACTWATHLPYGLE